MVQRASSPIEEQEALSQLSATLPSISKKLYEYLFHKVFVLCILFSHVLHMKRDMACFQTGGNKGILTIIAQLNVKVLETQTTTQKLTLDGSHGMCCTEFHIKMSNSLQLCTEIQDSKSVCNSTRSCCQVGTSIP